ncbi:alpha/beta fold hydrolase [Actinoplanes awajinensis]|uniref:alpha/beta fold hydrolase n=1 Tax=Actinoplanes awajinensis TaxID=135946 RepID=UPI001E56FF7A|nr:alpha/beta hydrolase [Actinoplanes awajinensis]
MTLQLPIVFIAALGEPGQNWSPVLEHLGDLTTVTYDRPGTGAAPPRPAPRAPLPYSVLADELAEELDERRVTGPAILVAHSIGSLVARVYAGRHPHRVAGLVHVDGSIPQLRLWPTDETTVDGDGPDASELDTVTGQVEVLTATTPPVPALVLTRSPVHPTTADLPAGVEELWLTSQRILARELGAPLIVADDSGHRIPSTAPDLVAYAIRAVHTAAGTARPVRVDPEELSKAGGHLDRTSAT